MEELLGGNDMGEFEQDAGYICLNLSEDKINKGAHS
jgi:hypothetical protein